MGVIPCQGTYFLTLDMAPLGMEGDDAALARRMTVEAGVTAVPVSAFYGSDAPKTFLRLLLLQARRGAGRGGRPDAALAGSIGRKVAGRKQPEEALMAIRALVWGENVHEQKNAEVRQNLSRRHAQRRSPQGCARIPDIVVETATLQEPEHGLTERAARADRRASLVGSRGARRRSTTRSSSACSCTSGRGWG